MEELDDSTSKPDSARRRKIDSNNSTEMVADTNDTDNPQHSVSIPDQTEEPRQAEVTPVNNGKAKQPHLEEPLFPGIICTFRENLVQMFKNQSYLISQMIKYILNVALIAYLAAAVYHWNKTVSDKHINWCNGLGILLIIVGLLYWILFYYKFIVPFIFPAFAPYINSIAETKIYKAVSRYLGETLQLACIIGFIIFVYYDTAGERRRLLSLLGIAFFIIGGFLFSKHPTKVQWRSVFWGIALQIAIGILSIRWRAGRIVFECIGSHVRTFLEFAYEGAAFIYTDDLVKNPKHAVFAFQALSCIYFLSFVVQILFYYGVLQRIFLKLGWVLQSTLGTTVIESVNGCASVFLGMTEAPILVQPYLKDLTVSELYAVMHSGFSTVAGTVFAAYISFGIQPAHIITASIMAAPAALSYAKLLYPETESSKTKVDNMRDLKSEERSVIDAACKGAIAGSEMVFGIIASIIAVVSFIAFIDHIIIWLGLLVGFEGISLQYILSVVFVPLTLMMGVQPSECHRVAELIGIKTTVNEFLAYKQLGEYKNKHLLSPRSEAIATFALCSFANPSSVGSMIATLSVLCPSQRENVTNLSIRAFIGGSITCFITACIAGLLYPEEGFGTDF